VADRVPKRLRLWRRRSVRDAIAVAGICLVTYVVAAGLNLFEHAYGLLKQYEAYDLDEAIIVAIVFGLLMLVYALRRIQDLKQEILKRRDAETDRAHHASLLITAVNNSPQGLLMFGSDGRLIACNERYIRMYGLSPDVVKPGRTLLELLVHRRQGGTFDFDPKEYEAKIRAAARSGQKQSVTSTLLDGRIIEMVTQPMPDGGWVATHDDVTDRRRAEARLAQESDENRRLFETSLVTDARGNFVRVSPISSSILGYAPEEMVGRGGAEFVHPDDLEATRNEMRQARRGRNMRNFETRYVHKQGQIVTVAWSGVWSEPAQKYFFTGRDVTESKLVEEKLRYLAHFDQLTGLPNRISLRNDLDALINSRAELGESLGQDLGEALGPGAVSIAMFDLDGFKDINDTLGHSTGDQLLRAVARRMSELAADKAKFYRLGGDEFVLVLPGCGDPREIGQLVDSTLSRLRDSFDINGHQLFIGACAGIAIATDGLKTEELISNADLALYDAKAAGSNIYRLFLPVLRARAQARRELDIELRRACSNDEFILYFQPQMRASDGAVVGAEALLRWRHPQRGIVAPGAFIDALAESPLALGLGRWILQTACASAARWRAIGLPPIRIGVNLFPAQFHDGTLLQDVEAALLQHGLPPAALELEITENIALGHDETMLAQLRALRAKGIDLAFDDFGTGYASLSYLARYPLTRIKIDQSFTQKITDSCTPEDTAIVRSLIVMAHNLGLAVIAEGVETAEQAAFLRAEKCEELQGFLYARPLPVAEFEEFLKSNQARSDRFGQMPDALAG
jgi:diguanylate cyclase (GGDEF)-like protein/PAS domain S-box-containing protein